MTMTINQYVQHALIQAYPGLRFVVKKGRKNTAGYSRNTLFAPAVSLVVEYDREGVLRAGGNEKIMRQIVKPILDNPPVPTQVKAVRFKQYVDPKKLEAERLQKLTVELLADLKTLTENGAPETHIINRLKNYHKTKVEA